MKIGFDVPIWCKREFDQYSNEEIIEYYFKLRFAHTFDNQSEGHLMRDYYILDLQSELLRRMSQAYQTQTRSG